MRNIDEARMLGGVPIRVRLPPIIEAKANGMSSFEAAMRARRAIISTAGSSTAVAPTLFINADMRLTVSIKMIISRVWLDLAMRKMRTPKKSAMPV